MKIVPFVAVFALAFAFTPASHAAPQERPQDHWNLADLYPDARAWEEDAARVEAGLKRFDACRGHLGESARRLRECLDLEYDVFRRVARMSVYSGELEAQDTGDPAAQSLNQKAQVLGAKIAEATAFVNPELLK